MTPADLNTLAHDIAEAAARCVGAPAARTRGDAGSSEVSPCADRDTITVAIAVTAALWRAYGDVHGHAGDALRAAAVLALRDRVVAQRDERARLLAADDAALRVIDETARVYDAETLDEAIGEVCAKHERSPDAWRRDMARWLTEPGPWSRAQLEAVPSGDVFADACGAILRRRAGGAP